MIDYQEIWRTQNTGGSQIQFINFSCEHCGNAYSEDSVNLAIFLYGIFCLQNANTSCVGFTCPSCLKTVLIREKQSPSGLLNRVSSLINFGNRSLDPKLEYLSSIYLLKLFSRHQNELNSLAVGIFKTYPGDRAA